MIIKNWFLPLQATHFLLAKGGVLPIFSELGVTLLISRMS